MKGNKCGLRGFTRQSCCSQSCPPTQRVTRLYGLLRHAKSPFATSFHLLLRDAMHASVVLAMGLCLSIRLSQVGAKTAKRRITQTTPHDSPGSLVF